MGLKKFRLAFLVFGVYAVIVVLYTTAAISKEKRILVEYAEFLKPHVWQMDLNETLKLAKVMISSGFIVKIEVYQVFGEGGVEEVEKFCEVGSEDGENLSEAEKILLRLGLLTIKRYDEKNLPQLNLYYESLGKVHKIGFVRFYIVRRYFYFYAYVLSIAFLFYLLLSINIRLSETRKELLKANEELNSMVEELENTIEELERTQEHLVHSEKMASIGRLVANISHDINTPAGIVYTSISELKGYIEKLREMYEEGKVSKEFFEDFLESASNLVELTEKNIKKIADLVKSLKVLAAQETEGRPIKFDLCELIQDVLTALHPKIRKTKVRVSSECEGKIEIKSFPSAISQVLTNLLENSIFHAFDGGEREGNIRIRAVDHGAYVVIEYEDDGKGMDEETKRRAFEPFFSTKIGSGGTGLGLSIVYSLVVEKLGGEISLESEVGRGTKFTIIIPKVP